ncbi:MAG: rhodanese-like domain-containing protein [Phycisphaerales bacterium]|nr:MAG: rhodanese-like domain-containing protein [Phycisphaerales bacterium]
MKAVRQVCVEVLVLGIVGIVVGFGYNAVRANGALEPFKNYFSVGPTADRQMAPNVVSDTALAKGTGEPSVRVVKHLEHPYQRISFADVVCVFNDPETEIGLNIFVDARSVALYEDGHIPGALQCSPYKTEDCLEELVTEALVAEKIVVYCNGGNCEDSIFMCRELIDAGVAYDAIYLFDGGWEAWEKSGSVPTEPERGQR